MSIEAHLKKAFNPLMAYTRWFHEVHVAPILALQGQMHIDNAAKELMIIKQLVSARAAAQYAYDIRVRWLSAA